MHWIKISLILCIVGCLKDFRPSESFVTDYLTGPWKNFTATEVNQDIYPVSTYSYFATLVVVFLITDFLRYKLIILLCGLSGTTCFLIMILGQTILQMQILEFFYGLFLSSEVAYYTYIYAKVPKEHYQEVTSHTKAASLIGRCAAGIVAQLTASFNLLDYHQLNYLTLAGFVFATLCALFLPSVNQSIYFHPRNSIYEDNSSAVNRSSKPQLLKNAYVLLGKDFVSAYTNPYVLKWAAYCSLSTCGYLQVANYMQLLWQTVVGPNDKIYNGAVDAVYAIIGAFTVFCIGKLPFNWPLVGDATMTILSLVEGALLLVASVTHNIWLMYFCYIAFSIIYHTMVTVANSEVSKHISEDSYSLIFGVNMTSALLLQSLLSFIVLNAHLALDIRTQYYVYGGFFVVLGVIYLITAIITLIQCWRSGVKFTIWVSEEDDLKKAQITENGKSTSVGNTVLA